MLCGVVAGLLVFLFARIYGEPSINWAIGLEDQLGHTHEVADAVHSHGGDEELVSRDLQAGWGLFTGVMVYAIALGGIFALLNAFAFGRVGRLGVRATSALLAGASFVAVYLAPFLKYPSNPPAVGDAETIGYRTALYFGMVVISVVAMIASINLGRGLAARLGNWNAAIAGGAAYIVIIGIAYVAMPSLNEVPEGFPAALLWDFRLASIGMQLLLWTVLGLLFGELAERKRAGSKGRFATRGA
jgi:hypothetical protein